MSDEGISDLPAALKGMGFSPDERSANWARALQNVEKPADLNGHEFTVRGETRCLPRFVTGHDFSRAASAAKSAQGINPEEKALAERDLIRDP